MKLLLTLTSPFARKVRIVMAEKKIEYEPVVDSPWEATTHVPEFNPLGMVPTLVLDDGNTLFDSRVIVEYLDMVSPVRRLIPESGRQRIQVKRWEALADGISDAAVIAYMENRRPEAQRSQEWITRHLGKMTLGLKSLSEDLGEKKWCTGDAYTLADIAVGCTLGYLDLRYPELDWRAAHPNLAKLDERLLQRAPHQDTQPPR
jgi:glutathione S-transferase